MGMSGWYSVECPGRAETGAKSMPFTSKTLAWPWWSTAYAPFAIPTSGLSTTRLSDITPREQETARFPF